MRGANDLRSIELAFRKRITLMGAAVMHRKDVIADTVEADLLIADAYT